MASDILITLEHFIDIFIGVDQLFFFNIIVVARDEQFQQSWEIIEY